MVDGNVDNFIGSRFGENGHLEVVRRGPNGGTNGMNRTYFVKCSVCHLDPELFGNAEFITNKQRLTLGFIPCGCGRNTKWSEHQWTTRVKRECSSRNYTYISSLGKPSAKTRLEIKCNKDEHVWKTCTFSDFLKGSGCPKCALSVTPWTLRVSDEEYLKRFLESGYYLDGTIFTRGAGKKWSYICPVCSFDHKVQQGHCSGVFNTNARRLTKGYKSCRCGSERGYNENLEGFLYVIKVEGVWNSFVGYGITNQPSARLKTHNKNLGKVGLSIVETNLFKGDGLLVKNTEKFLKNHYPLFAQETTGFKTEATYPIHWDEILLNVSSKLQTHKLNKEL